MRPLHRLASAVLLGIVGTAAGAHAQSPDPSYGNRALQRFVTQVRGDPRLPDSLRRITIGGLDSLATGSFAMLDDSATGFYLQTVVAVLRQLPDSQCAEMLLGSGDTSVALLTLIPSVDSATVDALLLVHQQVLLAAARPVPRAVATPAEMQSAIGNLVSRLSPGDRDRFLSIARHPPPSVGDACWATRTLFGQFALLPPAEVGPLFRAMARQAVERQ